MYNLLTWLDGKKTVILGILGLINTYCISSGLESASTGNLVAGILLILGGGTVYASNKLLGTATRVKQ